MRMKYREYPTVYRIVIEHTSSRDNHRRTLVLYVSQRKHAVLELNSLTFALHY
jgi:hypothetical protein